MLRTIKAPKDTICAKLRHTALGAKRSSGFKYGQRTLKIWSQPRPISSQTLLSLSFSTQCTHRASNVSSAIFQKSTLTSELPEHSKKNVDQHLRSLASFSPWEGDPIYCFSKNKCDFNKGASPWIQTRCYSSQRDVMATANGDSGVAEIDSRNALNRLLTAKSGLFDDHRLSYGTKSTSTIAKTLAFFFLCKFEMFTNNAEKIMKVARLLLGRRLADSLIRFLVYNQFVVEPDEQAIMKTVRQLGLHGVGVLLCVPIEDDAGAHQVNENFLDNNLDLILNSINIASAIGVSDPLVQLRVTALMSGTLAKIVAQIASKCVAPDEDFLCNPDLPISLDTIEVIVKAMQGEDVDFFELPGWKDFPESRIDELKRALLRFGTLAKSIKDYDVTAMIDAEYTYLNPALRHLSFAIMEICNQDKPRVFYTYQAYLKSTYSMLCKDLALAQSRGICFGVKLVRGAYMVKERRLANDHGYEDPVNESFDHTSASYHRCLDLLLTTARQDETRVRFILASHNEDTLYYAFERMNQLGLSPLSPAIMFGQLYGMADHISYVLGASGCRIVKSVPYGTVDDTIPYLARRAQENKSVLVNARKERTMLKRSLADKLLFR